MPIRGNCNSLWNEFPEFQVKGYSNQLVLLDAQPAHGYRYAVPDYWRDQFPHDIVVDRFTYVSNATTPYYWPGTSLNQTVADALIAQYNYELAPCLVTSLDANKKAPSGRQVSISKPHLMYCPR